MTRKFKLALAGRPNVGKSTLFNRLTQGGKAVVHSAAGITRDVNTQPANLGSIEFLLLDTAGADFGSGVNDADTQFAKQLTAMSQSAWQQADIILFMLDGRDGILPADEEIAQLLRRTGKPVILSINKADVRSADDVADQAPMLGFGEPVLLSAEHGDGLGVLADELLKFERTFTPAEEEAVDENALRVAIIGRPNAGKSTLVNQLLKDKRMLTGPMAGLTREAISHVWQVDDKRIELVDTPGIRKRGKVVQELEQAMVGTAITAIRRAHVVVLMLDATTFRKGERQAGPLEAQDAKLASMAAAEGKALVVVLNKWDLVEEHEECLEQARWQLEKEIISVRGIPLVCLSAETGKGVAQLWPAIQASGEAWQAEMTTGDLNRWLEDATRRNPAPRGRTGPIKLKFMRQVANRPPTFLVFGSRLKEMTPAYQRYLTNRLCADFGITGTPIRWEFKAGDNPFDKKN